MADNCNQNTSIKFGVQHILWFLATLFFLYQYGIRSAVPSVLNEDLQKYFSMDATMMGGLVSAFYLAYTLMQIPVGLIIDRCSARKILIFAYIGVSFGEICFITTNTYLIAIIGQIILGIGCSFGFVLAMKVCNDYFPRNKIALIASISTSSGSLGPVMASPLLAYLSGIFHWKSVVIVASLLGIVLSLLCAILIKEKSLVELKSLSQTDNSNEDISFYKMWLDIKGILVNRQYIWLSVFSMLSLGALSAFCDTWGLSFLRHSYGFTKEEASVFVPIAYAGTIIGGPIAALLSKKLQSFKEVMLIETVILCCLYAILIFTNISKPLLVILLFSLGIIGSCQFLAFPAALCCASKSLGATLTGVVNMITMLGVTVLAYLIGLVLDLSNKYTGSAGYSLQDYRNSFILLIVCVALSGVALLFTKDVYPIDNGEK